MITIDKCEQPTAECDLVPQGFSQDLRLSTDALAVGIWLNSQPRGSTMEPDRILAAFSERESPKRGQRGREWWSRVSRELKQAGYLEVKRKRSDGGQFVHDLVFNIAGPSENSRLTTSSASGVAKTGPSEPGSAASGSSASRASGPGPTGSHVSAAGSRGAGAPASGAADPGSSMSRPSSSGFAGQGSTASGSAAVDSSDLGATAYRSAVPGSSVPGSSVPGSSAPGSSVPGSSVPGSSAPRSSVPGSSASDVARTGLAGSRLAGHSGTESGLAEAGGTAMRPAEYRTAESRSPGTGPTSPSYSKTERVHSDPTLGNGKGMPPSEAVTHPRSRDLIGNPPGLSREEDSVQDPAKLLADQERDREMEMFLPRPTYPHKGF